jgi:dTDP-4-amino-4,6-dideoxygalactose transaminase
LKNIIKDVSLPISEEIHDTTLSLPISYGHSRKDIYEVVKTINGFE